MPGIRNSYQEGSIVRTARAKGPDQWVYRWRETQPDGTVLRRSKIVGDLTHYPSKADAKRLVENFRSELNAATPVEKIGCMTVAEAWGHFQANELRDPDSDRSPTTIQSYLDYYKRHIIPKWGDVPLDEVKSVAVERWLRSLRKSPAPSSKVTTVNSAALAQSSEPLAPASKAKIRNHMSSLFSHCIRHELYSKLNPIASVRQSAVRQHDPDILTLDEIRSIINHIQQPAIQIMVATAAASALRRSEVRGLKWADLDLHACWFNLQRGYVSKDQTKMKTRASRKGVEMLPALAAALLVWRDHTPYNQESDWVFASPFTNGKRPYWPESALQDHIKPAAAKAGITKRVTWHTFRHSLASFLGQQGEGVKTVQELLRHATSRITIDTYQQGSTEAKRSALNRVAGILAAPGKSS
ncbi:MAG: tyrosine-type recombinase/integrase [Terracidiphilus sp.]|jgi:integrase